ncbi:MAG: response regulator transcription factor [Anaerolineae bacterium]|nr:MAG: response regulator transcription factor [Anaerolineae bacterium]
MAKILTVDDDRTLLRFMSEYLEGEGFQVVTADRGTKALKLFYDQRPDLVVLDVMMPGMDGWEVCARLRELSDSPVIMLTAKSSEADKLRGFRLGVDDYVTKPFSLAELTARIHAVLARAGADENEKDNILRVGPLAVDTRRREVVLNDEPLPLTPTEFRLLSALARHAGAAISQEDLVTEVWGDYRQKGGSALRRYVWFLRQKIEQDPNHPQLLVTVRGYGYRLEPG